MSTLLSADRVIKNAYDEATQALKTIPASSTSFEIELSAADGDNVQTIPKDINTKVSLTTSSTGVVVPVMSAVGIKSINVVTNTTSTLTGPQVLTLQYSPSDSDDVWISTSLTVTPSGTNGVAVAGTALTSLVARRVRVSIAAAISSGTFDVYVVGQAV